jgi:hypothetical protein
MVWPGTLVRRLHRFRIVDDANAEAGRCACWVTCPVACAAANPVVDTMDIYAAKFNDGIWAKLADAFNTVTDLDIEGAHSARGDVVATLMLLDRLLML